jgi:hypothetical protein
MRPRDQAVATSMTRSRRRASSRLWEISMQPDAWRAGYGHDAAADRFDISVAAADATPIDLFDAQHCRHPRGVR